MSKEKFYDTKIKITPVGINGEVRYKPLYARLIVRAYNAEDARKSALIVVKEAYGKSKENIQFKIEVTKCNYQKIDGVINASQVISENQKNNN